MSRFGYSFPVAAGSQVTVYIAGSTSVLLPDTLFADKSSGTTLANPFTVTGTLASFFLSKSQLLNVGVKSPSGSAPTVAAAVAASAAVQYGTHKDLAGRAVCWFPL
jgi:hypothetical protein